MSEKRRRFGDKFKAKVALEASQNDKTIAELASKYKIHPNQVRRWKREFLAAAPTIFSSPKDKDKELKELQKEKDALSHLIGNQTIEIEWLKKKLKLFQII